MEETSATILAKQMNFYIQMELAHPLAVLFSLQEMKIPETIVTILALQLKSCYIQEIVWINVFHLMLRMFTVETTFAISLACQITTG